MAKLLAAASSVMGASEREIVTTPSEMFAQIEKYVLAFEGDIYGEYVRDSKILGCMPSNMHIRLEPVMMAPFLNILSLKYQVVCNDIEGLKYYRIFKLYARAPNNWVQIVILPMKRFDFRTFQCPFDCNLLAINSNGIMIWRLYPQLRAMVDRFFWIRERILAKRFCLSHKFLSEDRVYDIIDSAHSMVKSHWVMDTALIGDDSWLLNVWKAMPNERRMRSTECAICQEEFKADDIVLNTVCGHNFHWLCRSTSTSVGNFGHGSGGLESWVRNENNHTCPCCRSHMFFK